MTKLQPLNGGRMCLPAHFNESEQDVNRGLDPGRATAAQSQGVPWRGPRVSAGSWQCTIPVAG